MKKAALIALGLFGLLVSVVTVTLVLAHRQIDAVEPPLPLQAQIAALAEKAEGPAKISYINTATQSGPLGTIGHIAVLMEWTNGDAFLLDTGMTANQAIAFGKPMQLLLGAGPTSTHGSVAEQLGDTIESVRGIGFSHLHIDHTEGLSGICARQSAPAVVFQTNLQRNLQNFGTRDGESIISSSACSRETLASSGLRPVPGFPGLYAIAAGGHTPGSTVFVTYWKEMVWVFSGDITNDMQSIYEGLPKHWAYTTFIVPENLERQAQQRNWLKALDSETGITVHASHDIGAYRSSAIPAWMRAVP